MATVWSQTQCRDVTFLNTTNQSGLARPTHRVVRHLVVKFGISIDLSWVGRPKNWFYGGFPSPAYGTWLEDLLWSKLDPPPTVCRSAGKGREWYHGIKIIRRLFRQQWIYPRRTLNWRRVQFEESHTAILLANSVPSETKEPGKASTVYTDCGLYCRLLCWLSWWLPL